MAAIDLTIRGLLCAARVFRDEHFYRIEDTVDERVRAKAVSSNQISSTKRGALGLGSTTFHAPPDSMTRPSLLSICSTLRT